ncbi:DUF4062 domain-containing protein [Dyadobacter arcticus]|uniref:Transcriptional regulator n=1 Tax=Dyadobacter arcticus TaxID=1078754 RepID=A0ABX0UJH7_9BACT|nr:DUF4062 domain-containing protein [Dyadobacter arcticus]NIJ52194.1 putative transcriptional regulator [Dyadobacter arcticus]
MSYTAQVYNVMIASPSDVDEVKEIARRLIYEWNIVHSKNRAIVLLPIDWKHTSSPNMGARPQSLINQQVLANADILVGIFWTRLGTPTGTHSSGTVEEIELHVSKGLPTLLYFSNELVEPQRVNHDQYKAVQDLRNQYQNEGILHSFATQYEFENSFRTHLALTLNNSQFSQFFLMGSSETNQQQEDPALSVGAKELLLAAANSDHGEILHSETRDGLNIIAGSQNFVEMQSARMKAKWKSALSELETMNMVVTKNGSIYKVTDLGFEVCDQLASELTNITKEIPELTDDAAELLIRAASNDKGEILYRTTGRKPILVVNGHNYMPNPTGKIAAHWQAVVDELESQGLIRYDSSKSFALTKSGFDLAAELDQTT